MTSEKPALPAYLDNIRIILTRTSHSANIGSAARAMQTMGLHKLTIVAPNLMATPMTENPPLFDPDHPQSFKLPEESFILASGAADVLENATIAASLDEALADTTIACALTSRRREITAPLQTPRDLVPELLQAANRGEKVALVFGNETFGLSIEEVQACNRLMTINGNPDYFSLNLAQAVIHLATAPKSNAVIRAIDAAQADVRAGRSGAVSPHLRDAHYGGAAAHGHGKGYVYPHDVPHAVAPQQYLPDTLRDAQYYRPTEYGAERTVKRRLGILRDILRGRRPRAGGDAGGTP